MDSPPLPPAMPPAPGSADEKTLAIVMHVLGLIGLAIVGPLVVWLMKKDESAFLNAQGRELLNFQLSWLIYSVVCIPLCFVLVGIPMLMALGAGGLVLTIIGLVKASDGLIYRFPLTIRFF